MQYQTTKNVIILLIWFTVSINSAPPRIFETALQAQARTFINQLKSKSTDAILFWNAITLQACANDYDTSIASTPDQPGPTTTSRAFAIIHGAMYDAMKALNIIQKSNSPFGDLFQSRNAKTTATLEIAIAEAAYQTLLVMYPKQKELFNTIHNAVINVGNDDSDEKSTSNKGVIIGRQAAQKILLARSLDRSNKSVTYTPVNAPGYHQPDPSHPNQGFLSPQWGQVTPFFLKSGSQFRASDIVGENKADRRKFLNSARYINNYKEVSSLGALNSTVRTADQTEIGIFWGYDGAPKIGVPPRLYNQIVRVIAIQKSNTLQENARLFALVNYALADAGISSWETKYYYGLWRPIIGVRQGLASTGSLSNWTPLGAPSDGKGNNFTPGFPSYVSGHSTFGSATFQTLRLFYGTDNIRFQFQSDEFNGITIDSTTSQVRPPRTRNYRTLTQAEDENFLSRIYLGVHWRIDQEEGKIMGRNIASYIFNRFN